ncbi:DUF5977 domain-containing protein [Mucilaginibacter pedocola]|uniref:DUF5977 domain-containing protein n=1 Tax=Mucilaginibacter pedocola TaxID=1792845 RepID=A0A1S9PBX8_9SPHI|nr:DUF5977 domain-containing protein [Mucilaginibacter pedocola]OOQ58307.1 hypothetical protein BC343_11780 [Mucilaginibacter pedocola]
MLYKFKPVTLLALMITILFSAVEVSAQSNPYFLPTIFRKPPNSTAQEKYGNYPVNFFSGVPDISIPLYEINAGDLKLPITLSYHASGNKVNDFASWAGLGWSVSAGGEISRRVMGLPDDVNTTGYLNGTILLAAGNNINDNYDDGRIFMAKAKDRQYDLEPDIFNYSFPGASGKFFFDGRNSNAPAIVPYAPIKITRIGVLNSFIINNEQGDRHFFGTTITSSGTLSYGSISENGKSGWPLEKIISQSSKDTISLGYTAISYNTPAETMETFTIDDNVTVISSTPSCTTYHPSSGSASSSSNSSWVTEQQLSTINFKNGKVVFVKTTADRQDNTALGLKSLQAIEVYGYSMATRQYVLQKKIWFYQSYFYNGVDALSRRLRLDSLAVMDAAGSVMQKYRFGYNTTPLPVYSSKGKDYWGYYNGKNSQSSLIPQTTIDYVTGPGGGAGNPLTVGSTTANGREPDTAYMQACILQRIYHPTGGYTDFTYQTNRYNDGGVKLAGGLRIATIKSYTATGATPVVKTYVYNQSRANFHLGNYSFMTEQTVRHYPGSTCGVQSTERMRRRTFVSTPTTDIEPWDGIPVAYPMVTEYDGDPANNIGKTVYTFRDVTDAGTSASYYGKPVYQSNFFARGQLLSKSLYKNLGGGNYRVVQRETMTYTAFPPTNYAGVGFLVGRQEVNDVPGSYDATFPVNGGTGPDDSGRLKPAFYSVTSDDNYLTSKAVNVFDGLDTTKFTSSATEFKYDNIAHKQVTRTRHTDTKGVTTINVSKYAADYSTRNALLDSMLNRNMQAVAIERWDSVKNAATSVYGVSAGQLNVYSNTIGVNNAVLMSSVKKLAVGAPVNNFTPSAVTAGVITGDSRYVQMVSFNSYDSKNNITKYTPRNSRPVGIIWDYQQALPVAQINNHSIAMYTGFEADGSNTYLTTNGWFYSSNQTVTDVTAPSGARSYKLTAGSITSTVLDNTRNNVVSYWSNGAAATVLYNSAYVSATGVKSVNGWTLYEHYLPASGTASSVTLSGSVSIDELRAYPADAQMTTYTYSPDGLVQIDDAKGMASRFEYDFAQRLRNIKDWEGDIVKNFNYHTYDMVIGNDAMSSTFTRNNCPAGTTPQSTTYAVAANVYYSSTKASANASATYDLNINGQRKANDPAVCGCPVATMSFTLSNTSSVNGWQANFSGTSSFSFSLPTTGNTNVVQVPLGTYTVTINAIGTYVKNFKLGSRNTVNGHSATFTNVNISSGSTDNSLSIF